MPCIARKFLQKKEKIRKNLRLATAFYICYNSGKNRGGLHMEPEKLLEALHTAEKLKDTTRHCYTSKGRHESVAEHSWRIALMAFWLRDEFPQADMDKVIRFGATARVSGSRDAASTTPTPTAPAARCPAPLRRISRRAMTLTRRWSAQRRTSPARWPLCLTSATAPAR